MHSRVACVEGFDLVVQSVCRTTSLTAVAQKLWGVSCGPNSAPPFGPEMRVRILRAAFLSCTDLFGAKVSFAWMDVWQGGALEPVVVERLTRSLSGERGRWRNRGAVVPVAASQGSRVISAGWCLRVLLLCFSTLICLPVSARRVTRTRAARVPALSSQTQKKEKVASRRTTDLEAELDSGFHAARTGRGVCSTHVGVPVW